MPAAKSKTATTAIDTPHPDAPAIDALTRSVPISADTGQDAIPISLFDDQASFDAWHERQTKTVKAWIADQDFTLKAQACLMIPGKTGGIKQVIAAAIGDVELYATAGLAKKLPPGTYRLAHVNNQAPSDAEISEMALAWGLSRYGFTALKTKAKADKPGATLVVPAGPLLDRIEASIRSVWLTRDLVNMPSNYMGPAELAAAATTLAKRFKAKIAITDDQGVLAQEYPAIYAVGMASDRAPRLIDIQWGKKKHPLITLVGKGVCFDTGGLDLKPSGAMLNMKKDMGGAAQALGLAHQIMAAKLPVRLRVLIPAVENAVSGNAFRPKDVINTRAGITVEIGNTDAEGRLVLADALHLAAGEEPDLLVDFATLTGAARVALGPDLPAMMTDDDELAEGISRAGMTVSDPVWRLPLWKPYGQGLDSQVA
ncbi:MAG: leucyl aminopeptidase family protein, partial [Pseudomonadota bacterium]